MFNTHQTINNWIDCKVDDKTVAVVKMFHPGYKVYINQAKAAFYIAEDELQRQADVSSSRDFHIQLAQFNVDMINDTIYACRIDVTIIAKIYLNGFDFNVFGNSDGECFWISQWTATNPVNTTTQNL